MRVIALCLLVSGCWSAPQSGERFLPKDPFQCPGPGLWADPANCQCFYNCANNIAYHDCCPEGDLWDEVLHICDYDYNVNCGSRPGPDGSTSMSPGSTTTTTTSTGPTQNPTTSTTATIVTTEKPDTTSVAPASTTHSGGNGDLPKKVVGMYILLADDYEDGFHSDADWHPKLYEYQQSGANVLFFTFIHPGTMEVPLSFQRLAATRGTGSDGAVPQDTKIIFAIGGYSYSIDPNPWPWLVSQASAEEMAVKVAGWRDAYGIDGIDLDLEEGAGSRPPVTYKDGGSTGSCIASYWTQTLNLNSPDVIQTVVFLLNYLLIAFCLIAYFPIPASLPKEAGPNMIHFVRKLRSLVPDMLVTQPTYGYPQIQAEIDVINASWDTNSNSKGLADTIGLMVYEGTQALNYVKNYAEGTSQWEGFPIQVNVPRSRILLGCKGSSDSNTILTLAQESVKQDLLGMMVWFCSVRDGLVYGSGWDCSDSLDSQDGYKAALKYFEEN